MANSEKFKIPESFKLKSSQTNREYLYNHKDIRETLLNEPFYFDVLSFNDAPLSIAPWQNPKLYVPVILDLWKLLQNKVKEGFKKRDTSVQNKEQILVCLSLFILVLHWLNKRPVKGVNINDMELNTFQRKPFNCKERLQFIMDKPTQFHAFIQLEQLFEELEKSFYKGIALKQI